MNDYLSNSTEATTNPKKNCANCGNKIGLLSRKKISGGFIHLQ